MKEKETNPAHKIRGIKSIYPTGIKNTVGRELADLTLTAYDVSNIYSLSHFKRRFQVERLRTERTGSKCCLLAFDLETLCKRRQVSANNAQNLEMLVKDISTTIRLTDAICFVKAKFILVLLADTNLKSTHRVAKQISEKILKTLTAEDIRLKDLHTVVIEYPQTDGREISSRPVKSTASQSVPSETFLARRGTGYYQRNSISNKIIPDTIFAFGQTPTLSRAPIESFCDVSVLLVKFQRMIKRGIDVLGAVLALLLSFPLMLLIASFIKKDSPGPVLFRQKRLGYRGRSFTFLKFRTMIHNCDESKHRDYVEKLIQGRIQKNKSNPKNKPLFKLDHDERITKLGRFLRSTSLDELPQLFNVLIGDMSLVGPRPPIPYEVENYDKWHSQRLEAIPGMTGLWQVRGRSRTTFNEMVRMDIQYIRNWSLWLDLKIILQTLRAVLSREGAL